MEESITIELKVAKELNKKINRMNKQKINALGVLALIFIIATLVMPMSWIVYGSLLPQKIFRQEIAGFSDLLNFSINNYTKILKSFFIIDYVSNSLVIISLSSILTMTVSSMCAFGIRRMGKKLQKIIVMSIIPGMLLPFQIIAKPLSELFSFMSLSDTVVGIIFATVIVSIPFTTYVFYRYFQRTPESLIESAILDGMGSFKIFSKVELPAARPAIVINALFCMIMSWNEILITQTVNKEPDNVGIGLAVLEYFAKGNTNLVESLAMFSMIFIFSIIVVMIIKLIATSNSKGLSGL